MYRIFLFIIVLYFICCGKITESQDIQNITPPIIASERFEYFGDFHRSNNLTTVYITMLKNVGGDTATAIHMHISICRPTQNDTIRGTYGLPDLYWPQDLPPDPNDWFEPYEQDIYFLAPQESTPELFVVYTMRNVPSDCEHAIFHLDSLSWITY